MKVAPFDRGYGARFRWEARRRDNPFPPGTIEHSEWDAGWNIADLEAEEADA